LAVERGCLDSDVVERRERGENLLSIPWRSCRCSTAHPKVCGKAKRDSPLWWANSSNSLDGRAPRVKANGSILLGDLIRERKLLWAWCCDCCRERNIDPATIPLPSSTQRFLAIQQHLLDRSIGFVSRGTVSGKIDLHAQVRLGFCMRRRSHSVETGTTTKHRRP
jgi:hypothetical protein